MPQTNSYEVWTHKNCKHLCHILWFPLAWNLIEDKCFNKSRWVMWFADAALLLWEIGIQNELSLARERLSPCTTICSWILLPVAKMASDHWSLIKYLINTLTKITWKIARVDELTTQYSSLSASDNAQTKPERLWHALGQKAFDETREKVWKPLLQLGYSYRISSSNGQNSLPKREVFQRIVLKHSRTQHCVAQ